MTDNAPPPPAGTPDGSSGEAEPVLPGRALPLRAGDQERIGDYRLLGYLGEGGMGIVYLGQKAAGRRVAIKVVRAEYAHDQQFRARFRRETESARRVPRFCTAEVLDSDPDAVRPYLVTEFIDGPSLQETVASGQTLDPGELEQLGVSMAAALNGIHRAGVIHRDLKPSNVLLSRMGPRVIDFGISRALESVTQLTAAGQLIGTPTYMAPEQFESGELTPATDVFAWGVVMAFAATGRQPFGGGTPATVAYAVLQKEPDLSGLVEPMRSIIALALRKDPAARPTAQRLLELLGAAGVRPSGQRPAADEGVPAADGGVPAAHESRPDPVTAVAAVPMAAAAGPRRRKWPWGMLAAATTTVVAVLLTLALNPALLEGDLEDKLAGHWRGENGDHYIRVDEDVVRVLYPNRDGRIIGTFQERTLRGWWAEHSNEPTGRVEFRIRRQGDRYLMNGRWGEGDNLRHDGWTLQRVGSRIPTDIARKLANPALFPPLQEPAPESS